MGDKAKVLYGTAEVITRVGVEARTIGYTIDGVTMTDRSDFSEIKVEELSGTIHRVLTDAGVSVNFTLAETTLEDLAAAIPGSEIDSISGKLILGGKDLQEHRLTLIGKEPTNYRDRVIILYAVNPTGEVSIPFKKGEPSAIPVTFSALVNDSGEFGEKIDAGAAPPELDLPANPPGTDNLGKIISVTFDKDMADPEGKHLEFWFTEEDFDPPDNLRAFKAAAWNVANHKIIKLTVDGDDITIDMDLELFYRIGSVQSDDDGILQNISNQEIENNVT